MFKVQDKVFYPKYGIGTITEIVTVKDSEDPYLTYGIAIDATNSNIFLPVDEAENLGLRSLVSPEELKLALDSLETLDENEELDIREHWKDRKKELEDLFITGDVMSSAFLIKVLYQKHQSKVLGAGERKIYDSALRFLVDEISCVKNIDPITSEHIIAIALMRSLKIE